MFDRSACARVRMAADAHVDLAALTALAALLWQVLNDHLASSDAPVSGVLGVSRGPNRGELHATQTKPPPARRWAPRQIELFAEGARGRTGSVPAWSTLPPDIQAALTELMTRLLLEHADQNRIGSMTEAGHDF
jgi:hypothetical protein